MSTKKKIKIILAVIMLAVIAILLGFYFYLHSLMGLIQHPEENSSGGTEAVVARSDDIPLVATSEHVDMQGITANTVKNEEVTNILIVGQDRRKGEDKSTHTRSDTMIICSFNNKTKKITLVSLMRDLYVPIPGHNSNRLNSTYVYGGMDLLDATIAQDFGVKIDGNVEVDFEGFISAVSELAPLTLDLTADEAEYMTTHPLDGVDITTQPGGWGFVEGPNDLYSGALLEYARMRHVGNSDWDRTMRQRKLLSAAFAKIKGNLLHINLDSLARKVFPNITTDMSSSDLMWYANNARSYELNSESYRIPADNTYQSQSISGMAVLVPDLQENSKLIQTWLYGKVLNEVSIQSDISGYSSDDGSTDSGSTAPVYVTPETTDTYTDSSGSTAENGMTDTGDTYTGDTGTTSQPDADTGNGGENNGGDTYTTDTGSGTDGGAGETDTGYTGETDAGYTDENTDTYETEPQVTPDIQQDTGTTDAGTDTATEVPDMSGTGGQDATVQAGETGGYENAQQ